MKILNANQLKSADRYTIENEPVSSTALMERAATKCFDFILEKILVGNNKEKGIIVVCGKGNNGGDGLVIARLFQNARKKVITYIVNYTDKSSDDFPVNYDLLKQTGAEICEINDAHSVNFSGDEIIIDAIFGAGLNKPAEGIVKTVIQKINSSKSLVISIDIPSGLFMEDNSKNPGDGIICADVTLTFECPKLAFLFSENEKFTGNWHVLDIGLDKNFIAEVKSDYFFVTRELIYPRILKRSKFSHKGTNGHALIVAGSHGKTGAAVLAAKACLRSGAGLVTAFIPSGSCNIMQTAVPEIMVITDEEKKYITSVPPLEKYNAIGIGPGIGLEKQTQNVLKLLIQNTKVPLVIDADALNSIAENKTWLSFLPAGSILTPHPKEFERLFGKTNDSYERIQLQKEMAFKLNCFIILKGAYTSIATPGRNIFFNSTGNPGMATAGSGDVLTGIITGLMAQGYNGLDASVTGVYLHGLAGDIASKERTEHSLIASDIIENLGNAYSMACGYGTED